MTSFALALGGGGARGLAHIAVIEALDTMGVRPVAIAGTSIGAAIGAGYAAGISGREMRRHAIDLMHNRPEVFGRLMQARASGWSKVFSAGLANSLVLDPEKLCAAFLPERVPEQFEELGIPLQVVTTDLYGRHEVLFSSGPLHPAIAASMAVPGLIRPLRLDDRILVDGGVVNPLPFDHLRGRADIIVAVDASVGPVQPKGIPDAWETLFTALQVMGHTITAAKLEAGPPDLLFRPNVGIFRLLDFLKASAILRAADPIKAEIIDRLGAVLAA